MRANIYVSITIWVMLCGDHYECKVKWINNLNTISFFFYGSSFQRLLGPEVCIL
jgi:hypothetical protein